MFEILTIVFALAALGLGYLVWQGRNELADLKRSGTEQDHRCELQSSLNDAAYDLFIVVDKAMNLEMVNATARQTFSLQDEKGRRLTDMVAAPDLEVIIENAIRNADEVIEEQINYNHESFRVRAQVMRIGTREFVGIAMQDITRLVRLNRARRDMVANISHELRHPIANIRLTIDALFHDQEKPKRKDTISSLRAIARETDALMWLVQEMSDLAMIESGQAIVRLVDVPLIELVDEAIERIEDQSALRDVNIVRHVPEKLHVLCDSDLAQRVLVNLLHNAVKWSPPGEAITVNVVVNDADEVAISVYDNGPGVPEEKVERIFERFYQVDDSRSGGEGTGLGLAICKHIVEAHGGRIWAEGNSKGNGGVFVFTLLRAEDEPDDEDETAVVDAVAEDTPAEPVVSDASGNGKD
jgi:two-component system phosphate regulon sensor histidine kinase PhoR